MQTNKLILAGYALLAVITGVICFVFYQSQAAIGTPTGLDLEPRTATYQLRPASASRTLSRQLRFELAGQRARVQELQNLVQRRESILEQREQELASRTVESTQLKQEADRYFQLLMDLLNESAATLDQNIGELDAASTTEATPASVESEVDEGNSSGSDDLATALTETEWQLQQAQTANEQTAQALQQQFQLNQRLQQTIADLGETSVPILIGVIANGDAELRAWAASALGSISEPSEIAHHALMIASEDEVERVRAAATVALAEMGETSP